MGNPQSTLLLALLVALAAQIATANRSEIDVKFKDVSNDAGVAGGHVREPWPQSYKVSFDMKLPYVSTVQRQEYVYAWKVWQDVANMRQKIVRDDLETVITVVALNHTYETFPRIDKLACKILALVPHAGPTADSASAPSSDLLTFILPDITDEDKWEYMGPADRDGNSVSLYRWKFTEDVGYGKVTATYDFTLDKHGAPVDLLMTGVNLFTGSHFDHWIINYYDFEAGPIPDAEFDIPEICATATPLPAKYQANSLLARARSLFPNVHHGDTEYDAFSHKHGRRHSHAAEYAGRRDAYYANKAMIEAHNAREGVTYTMGVNRFSDWTREEFEATLLRNADSAQTLSGTAVGMPPEPDPENPPPDVVVHKPGVEPGNLPQSVSWRYTGQDAVVKDQATCGSCYAFGLVVTLEAAYFRQTGKTVRLSEQKFVDCSWDYGNDGCFGGFQDTAARWLKETGAKLPVENAYPYIGAMDWCRTDIPEEDLVDLAGVQQVWVGGGEKGLMDALYFKGPVTVNIDVPHAMAYYKDGIFDEAICANSSTPWRVLAHAVTAVGYGTSPEGKDYWLIRNSWSTDWGDRGYFKVARQPNDCGITRMGLYVQLPDLEHRNGTRRAQQQYGTQAR